MKVTVQVTAVLDSEDVQDLAALCRRAKQGTLFMSDLLDVLAEDSSTHASLYLEHPSSINLIGTVSN